MATAGSIVIDLLMKTGSFETDTARAEKRLQQFGKAAGQAAAVFVTGAAAAVAAGGNWTRQVAELSSQIDKLSRLSGTDADTFQRWAAGAASVGIEQDKLSDILKDTQDKMGDFLQTGGGPLADFFEKIAPKMGITADQFRKLSGPDALGAYVTALEKAGLSQSEMVFYMEAIASDSTLLLPLLKNNAQGMREWGDEAAAFGAIIDGKTSEAMKGFRDQSNRMDLMARGLKVELAEGLTPAFVDLNRELNSPDAQEGLAAFIRLIGDFTQKAAEATAGITKLTGSYSGWLKDLGFMPTSASDSVAAMQAERKRLEAQLNSWRMSAGEALNVFPESARDDIKKRISEIDSMIKASPFLGVTGKVETTAEVASPYAVRLPPSTGVVTDKTTKGKSDAERAAESLEQAYRSANAQLERQVALFDDTSNLARAAYDIQFGGLQGIDATSQSALRSTASLLDMLGNIDEAEAIMTEDAQRFADAFDSMFGIADEAADSHFSQISAYADQAARNMQDTFADFLFDPFAEGMGGMVEGFAKSLQRMAAEAASAKIFEQFGGWASSYSGVGSSWINAIGAGISKGKGFADGGYTGPGGKYDEKGVVHAGEYVVNAADTRRLGVGYLDMLTSMTSERGPEISTQRKLSISTPSPARGTICLH